MFCACSHVALLTFQVLGFKVTWLCALTLKFQVKSDGNGQELTACVSAEQSLHGTE